VKRFYKDEIKEEVLKKRNLEPTEIEVIAIFRGKLFCEHAEGYRLFPPG
jgi:hypothetical protein